MKSILLLVSLLFSSIAISQPKDYEKYKVYKKHRTHTHKEYVKREIPKNFKENELYKKIDHLIKKGKKADFYKQKDSHSQSSKNSKSRRHKWKFKRFLKKLKGQFVITEIDNENDDLLKIKIEDSKSKYYVKSLKYKLESFKNESKSIETYSENNNIFADIDITELPLGEFDVYFKLEAFKTNDHGKKKGHSHKKPKIFYTKGKFEKIESQKVFSALNITQYENRGVIQANASESYSTVGDIVKYIYRSYQNNVLVDEVVSTYTPIYIYFTNLGEFEVEVTSVDSLGNENTTDKQVVTITNPAPVLVYKITEENEGGHYTIDTTGSFDHNGTVDFMRVTLLSTTTGEAEYFYDYFEYSEKSTFVIPESNRDFILRLRVYDDSYQFTEVFKTIKYEGEIAPRVSNYYIEQDGGAPYTYYVGADFDGGGNITEFHYKATHEDGTTIYPSSDNTIKDSVFYMPKTGNWTFELFGIDENGVKSNVFTTTVLVEWEASQLIPFYNWHYIIQDGSDPRIVYVGSEFYDQFGQVVSYSYKATHSDGTVITGIRGSAQHNEFRIPKKGEWTFEIIATDNEGYKSEPFLFTQNIQWAFDNPVAEIILERDPSNPYRFYVSENKSYPLSEVDRFDLKLTHIESGETSDRNDSGSMFDFNLWKRGNWLVEYSYVDQFGLRSNVQSINLNVEQTTLNMNLSQSVDTKTFKLNLLSAEDVYGKTPVIYIIKATHESGSIYDYQTSSFPYTLDLNITGNWIVEVTSIDEFNIESGKFSQGVVSVIPNLKPIASLLLFQGSSWNELNLDATWSYDVDGYVSSFHYKFKHVSGLTLDYSTTSLFSTFLLPEIEGMWMVELTVFDEEGLSSDIYNSSIYIENPNHGPVAQLSCSYKDYTITCDGSSSYDEDGDELTYIYKYNNEIVSSLNGLVIINPLSNEKTGTVEFFVSDIYGVNSETKYYSIQLDEIQSPDFEIKCSIVENPKIECFLDKLNLFGASLDSVQWTFEGKDFFGLYLKQDALSEGNKVITATVLNDLGMNKSKSISIDVIDERSVKNLLSINEPLSKPFFNIDEKVAFNVRAETDNLLFYINDEYILPENIIKAGNTWTLDYPLVDGSNYIKVYLNDDSIDFNKRSVEYKVIAGSNYSNINLLNKPNNENLSITVYDLESDNVYLLPHSDFIENLPQKSNLLFFTQKGSNVSYYYYTDFDGNNITLNFSSETSISEQNDDFSNGIDGWNVIEGRADKSVVYDKIFEENINTLSLLPSSEGITSLRHRYISNKNERNMQNRMTLNTKNEVLGIVCQRNITKNISKCSHRFYAGGSEVYSDEVSGVFFSSEMPQDKGDLIEIHYFVKISREPLTTNYTLKFLENILTSSYAALSDDRINVLEPVYNNLSYNAVLSKKNGDKLNIFSAGVYKDEVIESIVNDESIMKIAQKHSPEEKFTKDDKFLFFPYKDENDVEHGSNRLKLSVSNINSSYDSLFSSLIRPNLFMLNPLTGDKVILNTVLKNVSYLDYYKTSFTSELIILDSSPVIGDNVMFYICSSKSFQKNSCVLVTKGSVSVTQYFQVPIRSRPVGKVSNFAHRDIEKGGNYWSRIREIKYYKEIIRGSCPPLLNDMDVMNSILYGKHKSTHKSGLDFDVNHRFYIPITDTIDTFTPSIDSEDLVCKKYYPGTKLLENGLTRDTTNSYLLAVHLKNYFDDISAVIEGIKIKKLASYYKDKTSYSSSLKAMCGHDGRRMDEIVTSVPGHHNHIHEEHRTFSLGERDYSLKPEYCFKLSQETPVDEDGNSIIEIQVSDCNPDTNISDADIESFLMLDYEISDTEICKKYEEFAIPASVLNLDMNTSSIPGKFTRYVRLKDLNEESQIELNSGKVDTRCFYSNYGPGFNHSGIVMRHTNKMISKNINNKKVFGECGIQYENAPWMADGLYCKDFVNYDSKKGVYENGANIDFSNNIQLGFVRQNKSSANYISYDKPPTNDGIICSGAVVKNSIIRGTVLGGTVENSVVHSVVQGTVKNSSISELIVDGGSYSNVTVESSRCGFDRNGNGYCNTGENYLYRGGEGNTLRKSISEDTFCARVRDIGDLSSIPFNCYSNSGPLTDPSLVEPGGVIQFEYRL